jgi:anti-sigma regulatory factor (Ser/Thr protein kinase)
MIASTTQDRPGSAPTHDHAVAFYGSDAALQQVSGRYVHDGLSLGERVIAVVSPVTQDVLRAGLDVDVAERVDWTPDVSYRELGAMFEGYRRLFAQQRAAGTTLRLVCEYHDGSGNAADVDRIESYLRFEAASNEAFSPFGHRWACLYDTRTYSASILHRLRQAHPTILGTEGPIVGNPDYLQPVDYLAAHREQLHPVPDDPAVDVVLHTAEQLRDLRRVVRDWISRLPVHAQDVAVSRAGFVLVAVGEAATNALQHGRPPVRVTAWAVGNRVRVRVDDHGAGGIPVTAGYRAPAEGGTGIGLLLARSVADTVRVGAEAGTTNVSLEFPLGD